MIRARRYPTKAALLVSGLVFAACSATNGTETDTATNASAATDARAVDTDVAEPSLTTTVAPADSQPDSIPESPPSGETDDAGVASAPSVQLIVVGQFDQPVGVAARPTDDRLFVIEQAGRVLAVNPEVADQAGEVVLDVTDLTTASGEQGLLGLAFHPDRDLAYVNYTDDDGNTVVAEFAVDPDTAVFDQDSRRPVLAIDQPFANHNGGHLAFGPDAMLFIGTGDGGAADDPQRTALDLSSPLGKLLRIDPRPDGSDPYTIPADNPFIDIAGADPAIWSIGLRNPWRFDFDPTTGDLWIADVGQNDVEEIDRAPATNGLDAGRGLDFGWSAFEGNNRFNDDQQTDRHTPPVYTYSNDEDRCSISGGALYRGAAIPALNGRFVFGDFCSGEIWALDPATLTGEPGATELVEPIELARLGSLAAIMRGPDQEIYAISLGGTVARFAPAN